MPRYTFLGVTEVILPDPACAVVKPAKDQLPAHCRPGDVVEAPSNPQESLFSEVLDAEPTPKSKARTESEETTA